jgi:hypothetical protein
VKTWIGVVVMMLAASCAACGGEETKTCERLADPDTCFATEHESLHQCTMTGDPLLYSSCAEAAYREAASCFECAPCAEASPAAACYADCEVAYRTCAARGDTPDNCLAAKINCTNACDAAHTCPSM